MLGAGGSARAVVWALTGAGAREVLIWNRSPRASAGVGGRARGDRVVRADGRVLGAADILVNCTSVGLDGGDPFGPLPLSADALAGYGCVVDLVYTPSGTRLIDAAARRRLPRRRRARDPRRPGRVELRAVHRGRRHRAARDRMPRRVAIVGARDPDGASAALRGIGPAARRRDPRRDGGPRPPRSDSGRDAGDRRAAAAAGAGCAAPAGHWRSAPRSVSRRCTSPAASPPTARSSASRSTPSGTPPPATTCCGPALATASICASGRPRRTAGAWIPALISRSSTASRSSTSITSSRSCRCWRRGRCSRSTTCSRTDASPSRAGGELDRSRSRRFNQRLLESEQFDGDPDAGRRRRAGRRQAMSSARAASRTCTACRGTGKVRLEPRRDPARGRLPVV